MPNCKRVFALILLLSLPSFASVFPQASANTASACKGCDLLIIGPEAYRKTVEKFIVFKHSLGVASRFVSVEWINRSCPGDDLAWRIHNFVAGEYRASAVKYVLLVGTYEHVPARYVYSPCSEAGFADFNYKPSDWFYAVPDWQDIQIGFLAGNLPKIAVGRLPAKNIEELERAVAKIIEVESKPLEGFFLVFQEHSLAFQPTAGFSKAYAYYASHENLPTDSLSQLLSTNVAYALTYAHGSPEALWKTMENEDYAPLMTVADTAEIQKTYGIHYFVSCFTGALDLESESLARTLITSKAGPIIVIANSRTENLNNPIPQIFWEKFFETGDIADSLIQALNSYISNPKIFNSQYPIFQKYNLYLCQVVYGDISWTIKNPEKTILTLKKPVTAEKPLKTETAETENPENKCQALEASANTAAASIALAFSTILYKLKSVRKAERLRKS